jgi:AcrR family transcriptional regulator
MAALGKEAQLGMGTIYVYFKSKEELINSLFKSLKGLNTRRIYANLDEKSPFLLCVRHLYENYLRNRIQYYEEHLFIEQCVNSHYLDEEALQLDLFAYEGLRKLLERGKQEMIVKDLPNEVLMAHMLGAAKEIANLVLHAGLELSTSFVEQAFGLCWDSIRR